MQPFNAQRAAQPFKGNAINGWAAPHSPSPQTSHHAGPRIDFEDMNGTSLGEAVQDGYKGITWTNFAIFNKDKVNPSELMCNGSSIAQATAIGSVAVMVPQPPAQDNGHEAILSVANSSTHTLAFRGLFVWSLMVSTSVAVIWQYCAVPAGTSCSMARDSCASSYSLADALRSASCWRPMYHGA
jgi:hypothetical protein